jgi:hypothetical protein
MSEFMPGKRAMAIGLCVYHSIASTILFQTPRFIPYSFGPFMEQSVFSVSELSSICADRDHDRQRITPEIVWGISHGFLGFGMVMWWQATVQIAVMARTSGSAKG